MWLVGRDEWNDRTPWTIATPETPARRCRCGRDNIVTAGGRAVVCGYCDCVHWWPDRLSV